MDITICKQSTFHVNKSILNQHLSFYTIPISTFYLFVSMHEKMGQLMEKHILQDCINCLLAHANTLFALLRLVTTNPLEESTGVI